MDASTRKVAFEAAWPDRMPCECGGTLSLITIEHGYSCSNPGCILHETAETVVQNFRTRLHERV